MKLQQINLYWVESPLAVPYKVSYRTFDVFEPILVEVRYAAPTSSVRAAE